MMAIYDDRNGEMQMRTTTEQLNMYVQQTLDSRVRPIEILLAPIYGCYTGEAVAYMCVPRINSVISGVLDPQDYLVSCTDEELLLELTKKSLEKAIGVYRELELSSCKVEQLFLQCSELLLHREDLYDCLKQLSSGEKDMKISLCFPSGAMSVSDGVLKNAFSDIRASGFHVAVKGYGGKEFPMEKLLSVCPDHLFTHDTLAAISNDREKRGALAPIINLAKSLGAEIVACGIKSDSELREFRSRDCMGFIPDKTYKGTFGMLESLVPYKDVLSHGGEDVRR